jgi:hypothetical protein
VTSVEREKMTMLGIDEVWTRAARTTAVALALWCLGGCARSPDASAPPDAVAEMHAEFDGQGVAILILDETSAACRADPFTMHRATFATCAGLDPTTLPPDLEITEDPRLFEPRGGSHVVLVLRAERSWHAMVALGPLSPEKSLVSSDATGVRPKILPLLVGGALLLGEVSADYGTAALFGAGVAYYAGKAFVARPSGVVPVEEAAPIVQADQQRADALVQMSSTLVDLEQRSKALVDDKSKYASDGDWVATALCAESGHVVGLPGSGVGPTEEDASQKALEDAANRSGITAPPSMWDAEEYCRVILVCQKAAGVLLPCKSTALLDP